MEYNHKKVEKKWQDIWSETGLYQSKDKSEKPKYYALDMFPYPSGEGLHVGHPKGYIATDVISRMKMLQGYEVLHPMGWDAFGLPAENYAIKNKTHPRAAVEKNIDTFKKQLEKIGFTYDWSREINTTDPEYYKWTQWIFLKMFEKGLAYESYEAINWCPNCKTGLANEDLQDGRCEICGTEVIRKPIRQWVLKMTDYAEKLLETLDSLDWEDQIIEQQRNWIGKSIGTDIDFLIKGHDEKIRVFTTRVDTIFGCTYVVLAPEHPLLDELRSSIKNWSEIEKYKQEAQKKSELERAELQKDKTGVRIEGLAAVNPFNDKEIPIFVADYVLGHYGTGAVMAVPAHDERDFEFAQKFGIDVITSIEPVTGEPRKNEENRSSIVAIVRNPKDNKLLSINWGDKLGGNLFIGGGMEKGEDPVECAIREIEEETGYKKVKLIATSEKIHHHYFAYSKDVAREIEATGLYFELESGENGGQKLHESEKDKFKVEWITVEKADQKVRDPLHHYLLDKFVKGLVYTGDGVLTDSGQFTGLTSKEAREKMTEWLEKKNLGGKKINYKMHDWVFSRQRYWGEPIPLIHCEKCGVVAVPEEELPVTLPEVDKYEPTGTGESPLANIEDWVNVTCPKCGGPGQRETNTMPQWAGSCWYYLRYIDPKNDKALVDKKKEAYWMPVDLYVGGAEHATRHLLYARFWHRFLYDIGTVTTKEPFKKLVHVGLIQAEDGRKMSKRWNNVVNPDDVVSEYGADSLRVYEMFMGPFTQSIAWSTDGLRGARRFIEKLWNVSEQEVTGGEIELEELRLLNKTIKKVGEDIEDFKFNTAISSLMILVNFLNEKKVQNKKTQETLAILVSPFAPHVAEEIWQKLGNTESVFESGWPEYDQKLIEDVNVTIAVQVNGKIREQLVVATNANQDEVLKLAKESEKVQKYLEGKEPNKVIYVPNKLLSLVVK
jgi:leucyl-tRNA synthetase